MLRAPLGDSSLRAAELCPGALRTALGTGPLLSSVPSASAPCPLPAFPVDLQHEVLFPLPPDTRPVRCRQRSLCIPVLFAPERAFLEHSWPRGLRRSLAGPRIDTKCPSRAAPSAPQPPRPERAFCIRYTPASKRLYLDICADLFLHFISLRRPVAVQHSVTCVL